MSTSRISMIAVSFIIPIIIQFTLSGCGNSVPEKKEDPIQISFQEVPDNTKNADGWFTVTSPTGGFIVKLPVQGSAFTIPIQDPNAGKLLIHSVGATDELGSRYKVLKTAIANYEPDKDYLEDAKQRYSKLKGFISLNEGSREGYRYVDVTIKKKYMSFSRTIQIHNHLYIMEVDVRGDPDGTMKEAARKVFDSFEELKQKPPDPEKTK